MASARQRKLRLLSVVGARPQFVKAAAMARAVQRTGAARVQHRLVHTGQHYDRGMSAVFFRDLPLPRPAHHLNLGGLPPPVQLGRMVEALTAVYRRERPDAVLVYGDTTSTLGGALAAVMASIPVAHIEAGLRSFNREMPEETNRVVTDHLARWLFCPTRTAKQHLAAEGVMNGVHIVGDVMIDALHHMEPAVRASQPATLQRWGIAAGAYILVTIHRTENTRSAATLIRLLRALNAQRDPVLLPLHPRTRKLLRRAGWRAPRGGSLRVIAPLAYPEMLALERGARAILTDSGGVQKEAYFWRVPCLTLRQETEWVETLAGGWNRLVGLHPDRVLAALARTARPRIFNSRWFGGGRAAEQIVRILVREAVLA